MWWFLKKKYKKKLDNEWIVKYLIKYIRIIKRLKRNDLILKVE